MHLIKGVTKLTVLGLQEIPRHSLGYLLCPFCDERSIPTFAGYIGFCSSCEQMIAVACPDCGKKYRFVLADSG